MSGRHVVGAAAGALAVAAASGTRAGRAIDRRVFHSINRSRDGRADALFTGVTELGSIAASAGAAAVIVATGRRREAVDALAAAGAMWLLGQALKKAFDRPRPYEAEPSSRLLIGKPSGSSWPSSHPAVLLTFVTVAARDLGSPRPVRAAVRWLARLIGLSRVAVGVHYPSDVIGGLLLGRAVGELWSSTVSPRFAGRDR